MSSIDKNVFLISKQATKYFTWVFVTSELSKGKELSGYDILTGIKKIGLEPTVGIIYYYLGFLEKMDLIQKNRKG